MTALGAKLLCQVHEIGCHGLKCRIRGEIWHVVWALLQWTRDKGRLHPLRLGGMQVFLMRCDHHHLVALEPEYPDRHLVGARIGIVCLD